MKTEYIYSIRQYQPILVLFSNIPITYFSFHERKGFVTHQENKSDGNEIEFLFLNIFRTLWGIKRLHTLVETNSHAIKAILEVKTE